MVVGFGFGVWVDLDLQSHKSYGHDPYTCKRSKSKVIRFKRQSGKRQTDGQTDRGDCITSRANAVGNNNWEPRHLRINSLQFCFCQLRLGNKSNKLQTIWLAHQPLSMQWMAISAAQKMSCTHSQKCQQINNSTAVAVMIWGCIMPV